MISEEIKHLFKLVRSKLSGGIRKIELTDDALCDLLEIAVGDYAERVQNFIIENNWASLYGKNITNTDLAYAMSVRTLDITKDYSSWFSARVGLQTEGTYYQLKKDFFKIEKGRQVYVIPAGREICKVMWITPPETDAALFGSYAGFGVPFSDGVYGQMGFSSAMAFAGPGSVYAMGMGAYAFNLYDVALLSASMAQKNQFFRCDLMYKVTAGPNGTHLVHLLSTPGSKLSFGGAANTYDLYNCVCWYTYYDVNPENVDECRKNNPDVVLSPDQIPLDEMDYELLNSPTKNLVRQLLIAHAAETLGLVRGKFSGALNAVSSTLTMDYQTLISMGQRERDNALKTLDERLQRMSPYEVMKKQAEMVQSMREVQKGVPLGLYIR